jgi:xanthine dehydrogenase accessory factor
MKNIYLQVLDLHASCSPLVLATVTGTRGSAPQKPGSSALFGVNGLVSGTVGGGVVEGKVQKLAAEAILSKRSGLYNFNLANDITNTEEAICGGQISILVDHNILKSISVYEQLRHSLENRIPGVLITVVTGDAEPAVTIDRYWMTRSDLPPLPGSLLDKLRPAAEDLISGKNPSGFSNLIAGNEGKEHESTYFLQPVFPPDQLVIAGAGHIGRAVAHLGSMLGFEVTVTDDRPEYANAGNVPDADRIVVMETEAAMSELASGENTYVLIVTRGHKDDASALRPCIGKNLAYIGMIGSKSKIAAMRKNFIENGWATPFQWDQIHAPVGLQIKSQTVEEIAVSIAAELVMVRNGGKE